VFELVALLSRGIFRESEVHQQLLISVIYNICKKVNEEGV
jgi:hypothetical protein